ncbi:unnamed protein product [Cunninghamella blakesleeana]
MTPMNVFLNIRQRLFLNARSKIITCQRSMNSQTAFDKKSVQFSAKQLLKLLQNKDVVFYQAPEGVQRTFFYMYISAGVQLLFWGNLASLAYVTYSKPESDETDAPLVLAPKGQRLALAGGLIVAGLGIATLMCTYPWRYIDKLILLKGGQNVKLITHAKWIKSHQERIYPVENIYCKQKVFTGAGKNGTDPIGNTTSSHIFIRAKGERMGYMLDRKGRFTDSKIFDGLWFNLSAK